MPRPQRHDYEPIILLPDVRTPEQQANAAIGNNYRAKVRPSNYYVVTDNWTNIFDRTEEVLKHIRNSESYIDEGLIFFMMRHCAKASSSPVRNEDNQLLLQDGFIVHRLRRVGCRIYMSQKEIGDEYGRTRQHVNRQIQLMKQRGIIVNQGDSWYEFDANLCWRGDFKLQKAYREIQTVRDGMTFTDGTTTLVTNDMDAQDGEANCSSDEDHPPPHCVGQGGENND